MGYHPNFTARALVGSRRGIISIIIPRQSMFIFSNAYSDQNALGRSRQKNNSNANESNRWCKIEKKSCSIAIGIYYK
jgi:hypothetical protein